MDPTAPPAHGHDELLIVRLFDGAISDSERERALDLLSTCPACESLFLDLGAISEAMSAVPTPARPRDFRLTESDAARLRRPTRGRWAVFGSGLRRSLGGSLAALGIVGVVLTGASSLLSGAASPTEAGFGLSPERAGAQSDKGALVAAGTEAPAGIGPAGAVTAGPVSPPTAAPAGPAATTAASGEGAVPASSPPALATSSASVAQIPPSASQQSASDLAVVSPGASQGSAGAGSESTYGLSGANAGSGGLDARMVWLIGFALLFAAGLAIATLPVRRRGRDRGARF